jgi:hypothetical protein
MYKFKIRASAVGKIWGSTTKLTQGNVTYLENWLKEKLYDRRNEFNSKYCDKGNIMEEASVMLISEQLGQPLAKNEEYKENDFLTGTCDIDTGDTIIDIKNSWNCFTFPLFADDVPNKDYFLQLQAYMELWGRDKAKLIYTLMDTPEHLIMQEAKGIAYKEGLDINEVYAQIEKKHLYSDVITPLRFKEFNIEKDEDVIAKIKQRVKMCQVYIDSLVKKLKIGEF